MNEAKSRLSLFNRAFIQVKQKCEMKYELTLSFLEELRTMDTLVDEFYYGLSFGQQRRWFDDSAALRQRLTMASNLTNVPFDERAIWRTCPVLTIDLTVVGLYDEFAMVNRLIDESMVAPVSVYVLGYIIDDPKFI